MAQELRVSLHELLGWPGPMTHRQYQAWQTWLEHEWDFPTKDQQYLMSIACEVRRVLAKNPDSHKLEHLKLKPRKRGKVRRTKEESKRLLEERAGGGPVIRRYVDKDGNPVEPPKEVKSE